MKFSTLNECPPLITDRDILEAMKKIPGYLDITPTDFMEVYHVAFHHALSRLKNAITAEEIMTRDIIFVYEQTSISEVVKKMADHNISGLPVLRKDQTISGVISEKDVLALLHPGQNASWMGIFFQCLENRACLATDIKQRSASDIMKSPAVTVAGKATVLEVAGIMDQFNINRLPVVDDRLTLLGIIARSDLVKTMG